MNTLAAMRWGWGLGLLCSAAGALSASAEPGRSLTFTSQTTLTTDSNFLLAPAGLEASERVLAQKLGVKWVLPVSLQQLEVDYNLTASRHPHFASFDHVAQNYRVALQWAYTPKLNGSVFTTRDEKLNAPQDSLNPNLRNKNTTTTNGLSVNYGLAGPWQLQATVGHSKSVNEQALLGTGDTDANNLALGVRYAPTAQTSIIYTLGTGTGTSQSANATGEVLASTTHVVLQQVLVGWSPAGSTTVTANLQHMAIGYDAAPQYDFSGVSGGVVVSHTFSPKTNVVASLLRTVASKQTAEVVSAQTDMLSVAPTWRATPKITLGLPFSVTRVSDQGRAGTLASPRVDRLYDTKLSVSWQPRTLVTVSAYLQWVRRSSSLPALDYVAQRAALDILFTF